jgi:ubiquitin-like modifier-activating enzyme ATG7
MDGKETDGKETKEKVVAADGVGVVSGGRLGCYFCQDIVAPGDSTRDRTLDQQCTVTRPGLALMAGALSVELMVGLLHHPLKHHAPADESKPVFQACDRRLGLLPHQIRGYLTHYQNIVTHGPAFKQCTACSPIVRQEYEKNKFGFLHRVFNDSGKYLEELSGIAELTRGADQYDLDDFAMSDDDDF